MDQSLKRIILLLVAALLIAGCQPLPGQTETYVPISTRMAAQTAQAPTPNTPAAANSGPAGQAETSAPAETQAPFTPAAPEPTPIPFVTGREWFAAPDGSPDGDGSIELPWDLETALHQDDLIQPGDILWLRGGTYTMPEGEWYITARLRGTREQPVIVRQYPGERATIDGSLVSRADYTWYWGFEITNSSGERRAAHDGRGLGLNLQAPGNKAINLIVHNTGHPGVGFWDEVGDGGEIYGAIIWGNGRYDSSNDGWIRGSGIYAQNQQGERLISDVISFRNFSTGMKAYTEESYVNGFTFEGNVIFDNRDRNLFISGRDHPLDRVVITGNFIYRAAGDPEPNVQVGYPEVDQGEVVIRDNYIVAGSYERGALYLKRVTGLEVENNTIITRGGRPFVTYQPPRGQASVNWGANRYFGGVSSVARLLGGQNLAGLGVQINAATDVFSSQMPEENAVFVRPNKYEPGRGHVIVFNWQRLDEVEVDLSGILKPGDKFVVVDAQNYFGEPVAEGVYDGSPVRLPLNLTAVSDIPGELTHMKNQHTDKEFNVFVVLPERP